MAHLNPFDVERNVPEELLRALEMCVADWDRQIWGIARDAGSPLHAPLMEYVAEFDAALLEPHRADHGLTYFLRATSKEERDRGERLELASRLIVAELHMRRRAHIMEGNGGGAVAAPYGQPALAGVRVDEELLVAAGDFDRGRHAYERGSWVFQLCPTLLSQPNSVYWVDLVLRGLPASVNVRVRLDPLMVQPAEGYLTYMALMCAWGRPLDWERLEHLSDGAFEDARWFPDEGANTDIAFTDLVWRRTGDELQFVCEEVPTPEASRYRASRYLHSIYDLSRSAFSHADGAIRFYDSPEIERRRTLHVREAGKSGLRVKIFRADGEIPRDAWCELAGSFFVWNDDMRRYFEAAGKPAPARSARKKRT